MAEMKHLTREEWDGLSATKQYQYVQTLETLLESSDRVLAAVPPCPIHGWRCVSHAVEWVNKAKKVTEVKP